MRPEQNYSDWNPSFLIDYIINTHHEYVRKNLPNIKEFLTKTVTKHSGNHPELKKILQLYTLVAQDLLLHLQKEEEILFPYIKNLNSNKNTFPNDEVPVLGNIDNLIEMMEHEHEQAGNAFQIIRSLSNNLTPPIDACKTYKITYSLLNEFEDNLHLHVHLENNILFLKAISIQEQLKIL